MNPALLRLALPSCIALSVMFAAPPSASAGEGEDDGDEASESEADTDADADASGEASVSLGGATAKDDQSRSHLPYMKRWIPEKNMIELGVYGGLFLLAESHELFEADLSLPDQGYKPLNRLNLDVGARVGYYPIRFFGIEAEGGVMPTRLAGADGSATMWTVRGHLVGQLGMWSITPFVVLGVGALGIASPRAVLGSDVDPALHFGGGLKVYLHRYVMLRLDLRDVVTHKQSVDAGFISHNLEALLGISVTLGRRKIEPAPEPEPEPVDDDRDGDGIPNDLDGCPDEAETVNGFKDTDGCPETDTDGDGIYDSVDACVDEPENFNDYEDEDGCPEPDTDGDGFLDHEDKCPQEPETDNGYQDGDGCPDEVPEAVAAFTGKIEGITFETDKDTIRKSSRKTLDNAVKVLTDYPDIRIEISGHTDDQGERDYNVDLSQRRAEAVKTYLVEHGIDESRIKTVGYGPDRPIDSNDTKSGRGNNRRIEFKPLTRKDRAQ